MNAFQELYDKHYYGMYRGQIIKVMGLTDDSNDKIKNGLYKVRVMPMMNDLEEQYIPPATSNMTVSGEHICLKKDEMVWVFFENGDYHYPVIFDRCNAKGIFPDGAKGSKDKDNKDINPSYYGGDSFKKNSELSTDSKTGGVGSGETDVKYTDTKYGDVSAFKFGDKVNIEINETTGQMVIYSDVNKNTIIIDKDGSFHTEHKNIFIRALSKLGIYAKDSISIFTPKIGLSKTEININDLFTITDTKDKIIIDPNKGIALNTPANNTLSIKNDIAGLQTKLEDVWTFLNTLTTTISTATTTGSPTSHNMVPAPFTALLPQIQVNKNLIINTFKD